jgi:hypothetical protein
MKQSSYQAELLINQILREQNLYLTAVRNCQEDGGGDHLHPLQIHTGVGVVD